MQAIPVNYDNVLINQNKINYTPVGQFHSRIVRTFAPLPENHKLLEIIKRITCLIIAPLAYLVLGIISCCKCTIHPKQPLKGQENPVLGKDENIYKNIYKIQKGKELYQQPLDNQPALIKHSEKPHYKTMANLKKSRLDDPHQELIRLKNQAVLTPDVEMKIDQAIETVNNYKEGIEPRNNSLQMKIALGRMLEIKKIYQDTHYVFTHGQAASLIIISTLIKEMVRLFQPEKDIHLFKFVRTPQFMDELTVEDYKTFAASALDFTDHQIRKNQISVDAYLFNDIFCESTLNYFGRNYSNLTKRDNDALKEVIYSIFRDFIPENKLNAINLETLVNQVLDLEDFIKMETNLNKQMTGNMLVICIPKDKIQDKLYRCHSFGKHCECHPAHEDKDILEKLQNFQLDDSVKCIPEFSREDIPQFRLLASQLKPENEVLSFLITPFDKAHRKSIKGKLANIAQSAYAESNAA